MNTCQKTHFKSFAKSRFLILIMTLALAIGAPAGIANASTDTDLDPTSSNGGVLTDSVSSRLAVADTAAAARAESANNTISVRMDGAAEYVVWIPIALVLSIMMVTLYFMIRNTRHKEREYHYFGHVWEQ